MNLCFMKSSAGILHFMINNVKINKKCFMNSVYIIDMGAIKLFLNLLWNMEGTNFWQIQSRGGGLNFLTKKVKGGINF